VSPVHATGRRRVQGREKTINPRRMFEAAMLKMTARCET
jgi:hypothetical protein